MSVRNILSIERMSRLSHSLFVTNMDYTLVLESGLTAIGFAVIVYSLYAE
ncbi:DUF7521 family protein [Halococcus saccharolyticus]